MDIQSRVRIIKKGTVEPKRQTESKVESRPKDKTEVKFAVYRNVFHLVQGFPDIQRNRCLVCSGRLDVIAKAQEYWNTLSDGERSICSVEAVAFGGGKGKSVGSVTLWNSMMGYNEKSLTKEEIAFIRR